MAAGWSARDALRTAGCRDCLCGYRDHVRRNGDSIWARYCLGEFWSARVALKEGHQLIRTGPYAFVRHPIYTGMLVATIGTALVVGEWRAVLAILLLVAAHSRKAL